ncbi:MAG: leucine-rich repeat domain-containing protein [Spirochaetaceae bacterium]|jgi:hypothetical protein|nr:leucine-rich repeat domain-containing protein [Spirochaetaceae bacterium]
MRKKFLSVFVIFAGLAATIFSQDSKAFVTRVETQRTGKSLVITDYTGTAKAVVIPASINGLPVRKIGDRAFRLKGLTEVYIPDGIEVIGSQAFFGNQLELVIIPPSVKVISNSAFDSNMLRKVVSGSSQAVPNTTSTPGKPGKPGKPDIKSTPDTTSAPGKPDTPGAPDITGAPFRYSYSAASSAKPQFRIYYVSADKLRNVGQTTSASIALNYVNFYDPLTEFEGNYKPIVGSGKASVLQKGAKEGRPPPLSTHTDNTGAKTLIEEKPAPPDATVTTEKTADSRPGAPGENGVYTKSPVNYVIKLQADGGIGRGAYRGKGFDVIAIPEGTTYIGEAAFYSNNLTTVRIPNSVRFIGGQAFMGNNLSSITIGENVTVQYDSFRYQFSDYYRMNKFKAGTYILKAGHWNYEGNERGPKFLSGR